MSLQRFRKIFFLIFGEASFFSPSVGRMRLEWGVKKSLFKNHTSRITGPLTVNICIQGELDWWDQEQGRGGQQPVQQHDGRPGLRGSGPAT
jgi:hypothetical protein